MSLPRWMEPLLEAGETKELDRWAMTEKGIAAEQLMERAGEGLAASEGHSWNDLAPEDQLAYYARARLSEGAQ